MIALPTEKLAVLSQVCSQAASPVWLSGEWRIRSGKKRSGFHGRVLPASRRDGLAEQYFDFLEDLKRVLNCQVDLVELSAVDNPYFKKRLQEEEVLLFAA